MNVGEASHALNIVFAAAQKLSASRVQTVLEGAMARASDDTFALRLLEYTDGAKNKILTDYSKVDLVALRAAFIDRMRRRYTTSFSETTDLAQSDWYAFRQWIENSDDDRRIGQKFLREYIGRNRRRIAQVIGFIYPGDGFWREDPAPLVNTFLPLSEITDLMKDLAEDEQLNEPETKALARMQALLKGEYPRGPWYSNPSIDAPQPTGSLPGRGAANSAEGIAD
jgi:hypothetical protein